MDPIATASSRLVLRLRLPTWLVGAALAATILPFALLLAGMRFDPAAPELIHAVLESFACSAALLTAFLAFFHFASIGSESTMSILGPVFLFAGLLDGLRAFGSIGLIEIHSSRHQFVLASWTIGRGYAACAILLGAAAATRRQKIQPRAVAVFVRANWVLGGAAVFGLYALMQLTAPIPAAWDAAAHLYDLGVLLVFAAGAIFFVPRLYQRHPSLVSHAFLLSLVPQMGVQTLMVFASRESYDTAFFFAHVLKILAYLLPLVGIALDYVRVRAENAVALEHAQSARRVILDHMRDLNRQIELRRDAERQLLEQAARTKLHMHIAAAANRASRLDDVLPLALQLICRFSDWAIGHVCVLDRRVNRMVPTEFWYLKPTPQLEAFRTATVKMTFGLGEGLPGQIYESGEPLWIGDLAGHGNFPRAKIATQVGLRTGVGFPILVEREVVAVMEFFSERSQSYDADMLDTMAHVGVQLGRVFERIRAQATTAGTDNDRSPAIVTRREPPL